MIGVLPREVADAERAERYPAPHLTFLYTLRRRRAIDPDLFFGARVFRRAGSCRGIASGLGRFDATWRRHVGVARLSYVQPLA